MKLGVIYHLGATMLRRPVPTKMRVKLTSLGITARETPLD